MIGQLRGRLTDKRPNQILVDVGGVGYIVQVPLSTYAALGELQAFRRAWRDDMLPATIAAVHLHEAGETLGDLIGGIDTEQVLDEVFRRFCIGK